MKFGLLVEIDTLKRETPPNQKPKVKFRRSGRQLENRYNVITTPRTVRFGRNLAAWCRHGMTITVMVEVQTASRIAIWRTCCFLIGNNYISAAD